MIEPTGSDGHCFVYVLQAAIATYTSKNIPYDALQYHFSNKVKKDTNNYALYSSRSSEILLQQADDYFIMKKFNSDFDYMLPLLSANTFFLCIYICSTATPKLSDCTSIQRSIITQEDVTLFPFVTLHLRNQHYSSTRPSNTSFSHNETEAQTTTKCASQPPLPTRLFTSNLLTVLRRPKILTHRHARQKSIMLCRSSTVAALHQLLFLTKTGLFYRQTTQCFT